MENPIDAYNRLCEVELELIEVQFKINRYRAEYSEDRRWQLAMDEMQTNLDTHRAAVTTIKSVLESFISIA